MTQTLSNVRRFQSESYFVIPVNGIGVKSMMGKCEEKGSVFSHVK